MLSRAQGTIEYLVVLAIVIVISLVVVGLSTGFLSSGSQAVRVSQDISGNVGSGGISILEGVSDTNGDAVLRLKNSTGEGFNVTKISGLSGDSVVDKSFNNVFVPGGGDISFSLDNLTGVCVCSPGESRKICEFEITLTTSKGLEKKQRVSKSVDCVNNTTANQTVVNPLVFGPIWARNVGSGILYEQANSVFVDSIGNIYVTGYFSADIDFGNGVTLVNQGTIDFFVAKFNSQGIAQWAIGPASGTGTNDDYGSSVFVDLSGNVYVGGAFYYADTIGFGNGVSLTLRGGHDFFVVKYNSSGVAQWAANPALGTGDDTDSAKSIFVDSSGNVYVIGEFISTTIGFGNDVNLTNRGGSDFFVVKYNSSGVAQWAANTTIGTGTSYEYVGGIFVDSNGNVYASGEFYSASLNFGNGITLTHRGTGNTNFFVVKYNSSGVAQWALNPQSGTGATGNSNAKAVFVDLGGNIYLAGSFNADSIGFGNGLLVSNRNFNLKDFFVVKLNSSGVAQWAANPASSTGSGDEEANSIFVDLNGGVGITGYFTSDSLGFDNGISLINHGIKDFFVVKYDSSGVAQWAANSATGEGVEEVEGKSIYIDSAYNIYLAGLFNEVPIDFGEWIELTNKGYDDYFFVKYGLHERRTQTVSCFFNEDCLITYPKECISTYDYNQPVVVVPLCVHSGTSQAYCSNELVENTYTCPDGGTCENNECVGGEGPPT